MDISGSALRTGGEPFTAAKAKAFAASGVRPVQAYAMSELGYAALGCGDVMDGTDMHLVSDTVAAIQREKKVGNGDETVPAFVYTTLQPTSSTLMLNMESGDYGRLEERRCGCVLDDLGLFTHLLDVRSYDKLTSEGVTFMGADLYQLVEEFLPARFGGHPNDYQLVEEEMERGLPRVSVLVAPSVGDVAEDEVVAEVLSWLGRLDRGGPIMAEQWRQGGTLRVMRRDAFAAGGRKILPLHILHTSARRSSIDA